MASPASRISSFTITQPFLGAPLQFQPALGSKELEELIDAWVVGGASKQDKLAEVTIDFYNHASVDLNTGALVRRYDVLCPAYTAGQSPAQSQSSGLSPSIYTPSLYTTSPSSSVALGDAGRSSTSRSSASQPRNSRVSKKSKKDSKRAEFKLPGFSIMTKDGIDVTHSANRGTKTKEQREHAHLMRIMKACEDCKKKKVRCDPSHRRSSHAGSVSTPTTKTSSPPQNGSPSSSSPSSSMEITRASTPGDFILFPGQEDLSSWTDADMLSDFDSPAFDLNNFDFDVGGFDLNDFTYNEADAFDFSFDQSNFSSERHSARAPFVADHPAMARTQMDGFSPAANPIPGPLQQSAPPGTSVLYRDVDLPELPYHSSRMDRVGPDSNAGNCSPSGRGPSEKAIASVPSSSSYANSLEWAASLYWVELSNPASPTDASSPGAARVTTDNRTQHGSTSLHDNTSAQTATREGFGSSGLSPDDSLSRSSSSLSQNGLLSQRPAVGRGVESPGSAATSPRAQASQLQRPATDGLDMPERWKDKFEERASQVEARRLDRSLCATITHLEASDGEPSPATSNTARALAAQHNSQPITSPADRHTRGMLLTTARLQPPASAQHPLIITEADALPLTTSTTGHEADDKQRTGAGRPEMASLLIPLILLITIMASSLAVVPMVVQVGLQLLELVTLARTSWVGYDSLATAVQHSAASLNRLRTAGMQPFSLLAAGASLLPLSSSSSGSLVSSSKRILSKHFRKPEASHWYGMLKRLSIGSSVL